MILQAGQPVSLRENSRNPYLVQGATYTILQAWYENAAADHPIVRLVEVRQPNNEPFSADLFRPAVKREDNILTVAFRGKQ
jgi:hypothetical protein